MRNKIREILQWSQKYTKTDMIYIANGGFWWIIKKIGALFTSLITTIAFANLLPKENYGNYQFIISILIIFGIFTLPGVNTSIIKSIAQKKEGTLALAVKEKIKWGSIGVLLSFGLAVWYLLEGNNGLAIAFLLGAPFIPFWPTLTIFNSFWNGKKRFDLQAKYDIVFNILTSLLLILAIWATNNVLVIMLAFLIGQTTFGWFLYYKTQKQTTNQEKDYEAIYFGKNLTIISIAEKISMQLDKIIIWRFLGTVSVAIYSFSYLPIQKILSFIPITQLAIPKLSDKKISKEIKKGIIYKFLMLFIIAIPASATMALVAPFLYKLIFPQYLESVAYFQILSILIALSPFLLLNAALISQIKEKAIYATQVTPPILKIILFFALLPYFGIWGIVISILTAEILRGLLLLYFFLKI